MYRNAELIIIVSEEAVALVYEQIWPREMVVC
jgi:hypothetical protein